MKSLIVSSLAVLSLALTSASLHADTFDLTLTTNSAVDVLNESPVLFDGVSAQAFTYTHTTDCVLGLGGCTSLLGSTTSVFTATYAAISPDLAVLNVNDVCTSVVVIGSAPGCQSFAFSATNVVLGDGQVGIGAAAGVLALADVNVGVGLAHLNIDGNTDGPQLLGLGVNGATDQFDFTPPAATPEPNSLCLMATGLVAGAGALRRKFASCAA